MAKVPISVDADKATLLDGYNAAIAEYDDMLTRLPELDLTTGAGQAQLKGGLGNVITRLKQVTIVMKKHISGEL